LRTRGSEIALPWEYRRKSVLAHTIVGFSELTELAWDDVYLVPQGAESQKSRTSSLRAECGHAVAHARKYIVYVLSGTSKPRRCQVHFEGY